MNELDFGLQLSTFLDGDMRLKQLPRKRKPQVLSLFYLASKFELGKEYSEQEINETLGAWHTFDDWAMLRRFLYQAGFLDRTKDGRSYWLKEPQPKFEEFHAWVGGSFD